MRGFSIYLCMIETRNDGKGKGKGKGKRREGRMNLYILGTIYCSNLVCLRSRVEYTSGFCRHVGWCVCLYEVDITSLAHVFQNQWLIR